MTPVKNEDGFTIIEVILFLALSGLIFTIGFAGIGNRARQIQFRDSVRSLDSYLQGQLSQVFNGVNSAGLTTSVNGDEVLLGKYIAFCTDGNDDAPCNAADGSRVVVYDIVGDRLTNRQITDLALGTTSCGKSHNTTDVERILLDCVEPRIAGTPNVQAIDWGTRAISANSGVATAASPGFGFLRSPNSSRLIAIGHNGTTALQESDFFSAITTPTDEFFSSEQESYDDNPDTYVCLQGADGAYAVIAAGIGERQTSIETIFGPDLTPGDGAVGTCGPV